MSKTSKVVLTAALTGFLGLATANAEQARVAVNDKPTIVLVHGAFAESSSWNGVIIRLRADGYPVVAAANPLRSVKGDAAYISSLLAAIRGPVILVGHSYAGTVISAAANGRSNVKALVFVDAFEPAAGETSLGLSNLYPGSSLSQALAPPVDLPDGGQELYVDKAKYGQQFAADVSTSYSALMASTQRPIAKSALSERSGQPAWATIPSWSIYGSADLNIPPAALAFMARRAHARHTVEVMGGSHVVMISHPSEVASLIEEAAKAR